MEEIRKIDTAVCNFKLRSKYYEFLDFDNFIHRSIEKPINIDYLGWLKARKMYVWSIVLEGNSTVDYTKHISPPFMNHLKYLNICNYFENLSPILKACSKKTCSLEEMVFTDSQDLTDTVLSEFLTKCPKLHTLRLVNCVAVGGAFFKSLQKNCLFIRTLKLTGCKRLTEFSDINMKIFLPLMTTVTITRCTSSNIYKTLIPLLNLASNITYLNIQNINQNFNISVKTMESILQKLPKVTVFLCDEYQYSYDLTALLAKYCPFLTQINMPIGVTDDQMAHFCNSSRHLQILIFERHRAICEGVLFGVAENCHQLHTLQMTCTAEINYPLSTLVRKCEHIHTLMLYDSQTICDNTVMSIAEHCGRNLTQLCLYKFEYITDQAMIAISEGCKSLTYLNVSECSQLTDVSIEHIAKHCTLLTHLECFKLPLLTTQSLQHLITYHAKLHSFHFDCLFDYTTDDVMSAFLQHCGGTLTYLNISEIKFATNKVSLALTQYCPLLERLVLHGWPDLTQDIFLQFHTNCLNLSLIHVCFYNWITSWQCPRWIDEWKEAIGEETKKFRFKIITENVKNRNAN